MLAESATSRSESQKPEIAERVREMRSTMKGLPLARLSRLVDYSPGVLCQWERGRRDCDRNSKN